MKNKVELGDLVTIEGVWEVVSLQKEWDGKIYAKLQGKEKENNYISVAIEHVCHVPEESDLQYVAEDGSC